MIIDSLSYRQRLTWLAHVFKACVKQHHTELDSFFRPYIAPDAIIFDVGAHAGQFSKLFAKLAPSGHVWSFEPGSYARSILKRSIAFNRLSHVTIMPFGLGGDSGSFILTVPIKKSGSLGFGLSYVGKPLSEDHKALSERIHIRTVDGIVAEQNIERVDFIKADIEGFEMHMLNGALATLKTHRPALYLELVEESLSRAGNSKTEVTDLLSRLGYGLVQPDGTKVRIPENLEDGDVFFVPL